MIRRNVLNHLPSSFITHFLWTPNAPFLTGTSLKRRVSDGTSHPETLLAYTFHPETLHPETLLAQTFHPEHPYNFHPQFLHPETLLAHTFHPPKKTGSRGNGYPPSLFCRMVHYPGDHIFFTPKTPPIYDVFVTLRQLPPQPPLFSLRSQITTSQLPGWLS